MGKIICGFAGIGKSSIKKYCPEINCYDLDSTHFKKQEGWEDIYIDCALALSKSYDYVFLTTYYSVMEKLNKRNLKWFLVYPKENLKEEYYRRFKERPNANLFADNFINCWDEHIHDVKKIKNRNKIILKENEYLSKVLKDIK